MRSDKNLRRVLSSLGPKVSALMQEVVDCLNRAAASAPSYTTQRQLLTLAESYAQIRKMEETLSYKRVSEALETLKG